MPITPSTAEEEEKHLHRSIRDRSDRSEVDTAVSPARVPVSETVPAVSVTPLPCSEAETDAATYSDDDTYSIPQWQVDDYDRRCLQRVMEALDERYPERYGRHKKSLVGIMLLHMNPSAYADKSVRLAIFDQAIRDGWLRQMGTKGDCTVEMVNG